MLDKGDATNPWPWRWPSASLRTAVPSSSRTIPTPCTKGESADNANKSAYPKTFSEPLTFELYEHHIEISEAAKP